MESTTEKVSSVREIESREDLEAALAALAELNAQEATANSDLNMALTKVREQFADRYLVTMDEAENVALDQVRADLMTSIENYCNAHRAELLPKDKKSVVLTHGTIGWRKGKDSVTTVPLLDDKGKDKPHPIMEFAHSIALKALAGVKKLFTKFPLLDVLRVSVVWDYSQILKRVNDKQITDKQLVTAGLKVERGEDKFFAEPKADSPTTA